MRFLQVVDTFFPEAPGGMGRVAWALSQALAARGHDVTLLVGDSIGSRSGSVRESIENSGVTVRRFARPTLSRWNVRRAENQVEACLAGLEGLRASDAFDIVHVHSLFTAAAASRLPKSGGGRIVETVHSPAIQELAYNWRHGGFLGWAHHAFAQGAVRRLEEQGLRRSDMLHALSHFTVSQMQREYPGVGKPYAVIPHWVDRHWRRTLSKGDARLRLGWPLDKPILFTVRQLRRRYGIDTAIAAVAPLAAAGKCEFFIGGSGDDHGLLAQQISDAGVRGTVRLLGRLTDEDLHLAYQAADLFVLPTRALECFGLIMLEALACGLPVIATEVGAIPETLRPILPDHLVPCDNPVELRARIAAFLSGELSTPPPEALVAYATAHFGEDAVLQRYDFLYREAMGNAA